MVLGDLGKRITAAVRKMSSNPVFDEDVLNEMLKEIAMALMAVSAIEAGFLPHLSSVGKLTRHPTHHSTSQTDMSHYNLS